MARELESILREVQPGDLDLSPAGVAEARRHFRDFSTQFVGRTKSGRTIAGGRSPYLLTGDSAKLAMNATAPETAEHEQSIMYAAPANKANPAIIENNQIRVQRGESEIPRVNACSCSTPGCRAACLSGSGQLGLSAGTHAINVRTAFAAAHPDHFLTTLHGNLSAFQRRAARANMNPVVRLNGTTDIRFDTLPTADMLFRDYGRDKIQYNEYTKHNTRGELSPEDLEEENQRFARTPNLYAIHSLNEMTTPGRVRQLASQGRNFAVPVDIPSDHPVFNEHRTARMPDTTFHFGGDTYDTVNGYRHDMRFLDPQGGNAVILPVKSLSGGREQVTTGSDRFVRSMNMLAHHGVALGTPVDIRGLGSRASRRR